MTKNNISRIGLTSVGVLMAVVFLFSTTVNKAHAAIVLDPTTSSMLSQTLSATGNLTGTVQADINAGAFTPFQSTIISATLGGIGNVLANISSMIGGIGLPNTGELPLSMGAGN